MQQISVLLICFSVAGYFAYHAISGEHGLEAQSRLLSTSAKLEKELAGLKTVQARLEMQVAALNDGDSDYIEELAAGVLRFFRPEDIVVLGNGGSN